MVLIILAQSIFDYFWLISQCGSLFLLLGHIAALAYRLLTLIQQAWRTDIAPDSSFLTPLKLVLFIVEYIPMRLLALTIASLKASKKSMHYIKHYGRHFYQTNTGWLLSVCSASLGVQLGGPAIYSKQDRKSVV